jgi:hypothetical protein
MVKGPTMKKMIAFAIILLAIAMLVPLVFAIYETKTSILNKFKSLVSAHPTQASCVIIGYSPKGTPILMFRFGNSSSTGRVLWDSQMHGGEDAGSETSYLFSVWLFSGDSRANYILAHNYVLIIPVVDNLVSRVNENHVNLNRNFPVGWGTSSSSSSTSLEYRGPSAGSEPETKALIKVYSTYKPKFYINAHMYGGPGIFYQSAVPSSVITTLKSRLATYAKTYGGDPTNTNGWGRISGASYAIGTAETYGAYSFLWEIGGTSRPPLSTVTNQYYKETRCFLIAVCSMCG